MKRILMIGEDGKIAGLAAAQLKDIDCSLEHAATGAAGLSLALQHSYDLIITDLLLSDTNGVALSHELRRQQIQAPLMMLTVKQEEQDRIEGVDSSADDYLVKPFSMGEFISRIKAMLRSAEPEHINESETEIITRGPLVLDKANRTVTLEGSLLEFSFKEFDLLQLLMAHPGKTYSRESLLSQVWGYDFPGFEHTVESHISRLRARIEKDPLHPEYILTTWGIGYRFTEIY